MTVTTRLSIMMFLQYAIYGSWSSVLSEYLIRTLGYSGTETGVVLGLLPLAIIASSLAGGQLADRHIATERLIGFFQLTGGVLLIILSRTTAYPLMTTLMFLYSLCYAPTLTLTNSMALVNIRNAEREFGQIRAWGTLGWIAAGVLLSLWRMLAEQYPGIALDGDIFVLAGVFSIIMGLQSFSLPHTPPDRSVAKPWAFIEAAKMLRNRDFATFMSIVFTVSVGLMFYNNLTAPFFTSSSIGVPPSMVAGVMAFSQVSEVAVMVFLLHRSIPRLGLRTTMVIGACAWPLRYLVFALGRPAWLVISSLLLHGFCHVFFIIAATIYVDATAPRDIRASAQALFSVIILGLGNFMGSLAAGFVQDAFTAGGVTRWAPVFLIPAFMTAASAVAVRLLFRDERVKNVINPG
jgi:nucleoside transporter